MASPSSSVARSGLSTLAIHAGQTPDPVTGAVVVPLSLATTFVQPSPGKHSGYEYSRTANPTRAAFEEAIAKMENGKYGLAFGSGSATTATVVHLLAAGDHVISSDDVYGGTNRYFRRVCTPANNISFTFLDLTLGVEALEKAITPKTRMLWLETPTNPTLKIVDIAALAAAAHKHNIIVVADNTFASPYLQSPLDLGADIVVHSVTKYINGHSDVVMGVLATKDEGLYEKLKFLQNSIGAVPGVFDCYMAHRGLKTLPLRMKEHCKNAMAVATYLEKHPRVERVIYPGLPSHPQHALAARQMRGFGGMLSFCIRGGQDECRVFLEHIKLFALAESLGAVESLAECPVIMTHGAVPAEQRAALGITDNLIRLSVGCEDIEDLIADLEHAFSKVPAAK